MKNKLFHKSFGLKAASGGEVTPEILARVDSFALKPLTAEIQRGKKITRKILACFL
jgi:hypothetical protein